METNKQNTDGDKSTANGRAPSELPLHEPAGREAVLAALSVAGPPSAPKGQPSATGLLQPAIEGHEGASSAKPGTPVMEPTFGGEGNKRPPAPPIIFEDPEDLPEFLDDLEREVRGAETKRQVRSVEPYVRAAREKGIPIGRIFDGLAKRHKITIGKTQFDKVCRSEFPDLF